MFPLSENTSACGSFESEQEFAHYHHHLLRYLSLWTAPWVSGNQGGERLAHFLIENLPGPRHLSVPWLWRSVCPTRSSPTRSSRQSAGSCLWTCSRSQSGSHWCSTHGCMCQHRTRCPPEKVKHSLFTLFAPCVAHSGFRSKVNLCPSSQKNLLSSLIGGSEFPR